MDETGPADPLLEAFPGAAGALPRTLIALSRLLERRGLALEAVEALAREKDSVELFWFPFNDWVWVRTLERTDRLRTGSGRISLGAQDFVQAAVLGACLAATARRAPRLVPWMMRRTSWMLSFAERVLPLSEALHYRRWIEVRKCSCVEVGFKTDPAFGNVREALRTAVRLVDAWASRGRYPLDLTVTLRFTGPSGALLSPSYGPGLTCYVEALCMGRTPDWEPFTAELCAAWMADPTALPHWAKEIEHLPGLPELARAHLGERLPRFRAAWRATGIDPGGTFVNELVKRMFLDELAPAPGSP